MFDNQAINIIEDAEGELRVSSLIVAARTENQHASVIKIVRDKLPELERFGRVGFEIAPFETAGGTQRREVALLNEPQSTLLMTFMRNSPVVVEFKVALVEQFYRMRQTLSRPVLPQTYAEALRELLSTVELNAALEQKAAEDAPKVNYVDTFVADGDLRLLRNVAKSLNISEGELRADLIARKWIYAEHMTRWSESKQEKETITRYSAYSHKAAYFFPVPNHTAPRFKGEVMHTLKVTPAGATAIARLYGKHLQVVEPMPA